MDSIVLMVQVLLASFGGTAVAAFLAKSLLKQFLARELERFKADLKAAHDRSLEVLRTELRVAASEREVRFSRWHEKQLDALSEVYAQLARTRLALIPLGHTTDARTVQTAGDAHRELRETFEKKRIFLSDDLAGLTSDIIRRTGLLFVGLAGEPAQADAKNDIHLLREQIPRLLESLRTEARHILLRPGISDALPPVGTPAPLPAGEPAPHRPLPAGS